MKQREQKGKVLIYFKRNIRLVLAMVAMLSLALIAAGSLVPQGYLPWQVFLKVALIETGTTILIASTIGVFLTEAYGELRELTIRNEIFELIDRMKELVNHPEDFKTFQLLSYMEQAGLAAFYPNRKGPAQDDLRSRLAQLLVEDDPTTIYLIGDTLRVFFGSEGPFTYVVHQVLSQKPNVTFRVLLLNPNCKLALYRSEAETVDAPFKSDERYRQAGLFHDSINSSSHIQEWNRNLAPLRGGSIPLEVRYYDCADYCLAVIFPDVCYTAQYVYADAEAQVQTPSIPMLKYSVSSNTHMRLLWNFNWIWENCSITYEEVIQSLQDTPVVQARSKGLFR
jgi:hypothetical protein